MYSKTLWAKGKAEKVIGEVELVVRIVLSLLLGGLIGLERELGKEPAGLRTHMLVSLGATLFTIMSFSIGGAEPERIAANIVVGIGFLGAGAIFKEQDRVKGLTTAADLWVIAAVGMAIGLGYYFMAIVSTAFVLAILVAKRLFSEGKRRAAIKGRLL